MIDVDARARLARGRTFLGLMVGVTLSGIVWDDLALYALCVNALVWIAWFLHKASAIHELELVQAEQLSPTTKEDRMKKT